MISAERYTPSAHCPAEGLYGLVLHDIITEGFPVMATGHQEIWEWENSSQANGSTAAPAEKVQPE